MKTFKSILILYQICNSNTLYFGMMAITININGKDAISSKRKTISCRNDQIYDEQSYSRNTSMVSSVHN